MADLLMVGAAERGGSTRGGPARRCRWGMVARVAMLVVGLMLAWASVAHADVFTATSTTLPVPPGDGYSAGAVGDFNGDGHPDLAAVGGSGLSFFLNDGSGGFSAAQDIPIPGVAMAVADLDQDGVPDVVLAESSPQNQLQLLFGVHATTSTSTFASSTTIPLPGTPSAVAVGDLNGDGLPDIAVTDTTNDSVDLFLATAKGTYPSTPTTTVSTGDNPSAVAIADMNGDGQPDIVVANQSDGTVTIFTQSHGSYTPTTLTVGPGTGPSSLAVGDLNGDGVPDIAVADGTNGPSGNAVTLFLSNGSGGYTTTTMAAGTEPSSVVIGDFNGDGLPDIAVANDLDDTVTVYLKDASGSGYTPSTLADPGGGVGPTSLVTGDWNGDGKPDLADFGPYGAAAFTQAAPSVPAWAQDRPPGGTVGSPYSYQFAASGRPGPTFSVASGSLPDGLSLDPVSGILSGTPSASGTFTFTVEASNEAGAVTSSPLQVTISGTAVAPAFTADTPPTTLYMNQFLSTAYYRFAASGNPAPTFSVASGSLPSGVTLDPDGTIDDNGPQTAGTYTFTIRASNGVSPDAVSPPITLNVVSAAQAAPAFSADTPPTTGVVGAPYDGPNGYRFFTTGNPAPTFSVASGSLPTGLSLNSTTGALSGTPTTPGSSTFTVKASNGVNPDAVSPSITIVIPAGHTVPAFLADSPPPPSPGGGSYGPYTFMATGYPAPTFSVASGSLPAGLTLSSAGVLSGSLSSTPGSSTFTVKASNSAGTATTGPITLVNPGFTADTPPGTATVGTPYSYAFAAVGSPTFTIAYGALPDGLSLDSGTGALSGTPTTPGTYSFGVTASSTNAMAVEAFLTIVVAGSAPSAPSLTADTPPTGASVGVAYSYLFAASGNPAPNYAVASGSLPPGLRLAAYTGLLSGTPTAAGSFTFTLKASNGVNPAAVTGPITINVPAAPAFTADAPPGSGTVGSPYSYTFTASGTPAPTFAVASGALPGGLSLDAATGILSGTPTAAGSFTFTVTASNGVSPDAVSGPITVNVAAATGAVAFTADSPPGTTAVGSPYSYTFKASGTPAPTFAVASGAVPGGLSLNATTGKLSGTPKAAGSFKLTVKASNGTASAVTGQLTIVVKPAPSNAFRLASVKTGRKGVVTVRLSVPDAGRLVIASSWTVPAPVKKAKGKKGKGKKGKAKPISYGKSVSAFPKRKSSLSLEVKPGKAATKALRKDHKLRVALSISFTPTGGVKRTQTRTVTVHWP